MMTYPDLHAVYYELRDKASNWGVAAGVTFVGGFIADCCLFGHRHGHGYWSGQNTLDTVIAGCVFLVLIGVYNWYAHQRTLVLNVLTRRRRRNERIAQLEKEHFGWDPSPWWDPDELEGVW